MAWPQLARVSGGRVPPPIPHDSPLRVNCLACHSGPSGVAEIRTSHPERSNCRQCHLQANDAAESIAPFARSIDAAPGGAP